VGGVARLRHHRRAQSCPYGIILLKPRLVRAIDPTEDIGNGHVPAAPRRLARHYGLKSTSASFSCTTKPTGPPSFRAGLLANRHRPPGRNCAKRKKDRQVFTAGPRRRKSWGNLRRPANSDATKQMTPAMRVSPAPLRFPSMPRPPALPTGWNLHRYRSVTDLSAAQRILRSELHPMNETIFGIPYPQVSVIHVIGARSALHRFHRRLS
jgi:hypothetical protein